MRFFVHWKKIYYLYYAYKKYWYFHCHVTVNQKIAPISNSVSEWPLQLPTTIYYNINNSVRLIINFTQKKESHRTKRVLIKFCYDFIHSLID